MSNWLDSSNNANCYKSMYVNGFIDISGGNIQTRNADNHLLIAGDSSFNSNLSLGKKLSIGIEKPQYSVDISGTVDLKDNLLMRGDISLNKTLAAQNAGTLENHNYSEQFDDYDNLILKTDQSAAVDTANDEFTINYGLIIEQKAYLKASTIDEQDWFGREVAVSGDYAIVGAQYEDSNSSADPNNNDATKSGAVYVFKTSDSGETWIQTAYLKANPIVAGARFGEKIAIEGDYAIIGSPYYNPGTGYNLGAVYIFKRDTDAETWTQQALLQPEYIDNNDLFGSSVAISGDYVCVGAIYESSNDKNDPSVNQSYNSGNNPGYYSGAAYIFKKDTDAETWTQKAYLKASNIGAQDSFGYSVAISGDYVCVGAPYEDSNSSTDQNNDDATYSGAVYMFKRDSGAETWTQKAYLKGNPIGSNYNFGSSLAMSGDYTIISAYREVDTDGGGKVYIFKTSDSGETWVQKAKLGPSSGLNDNFGYSLAINGDKVIVGAHNDSSNDRNDPTNTNSYWSGAAYIFERDSNAETWTQKAYLKASTIDTYDAFGFSVGLTDNYAIAGAYKESSNNPNDQTINQTSGSQGYWSGAAYIFKSTITNELTAPTNGANNLVLSDDGNRYAYIHGWTGATTQGAGTGGTLKVRSYNNGWSEDTVNDSGSLSVSNGQGGKNLYISGDGNVIVTAQFDSENWNNNNDTENGKIYMWIRNSSTNQWDRTIINIDNSFITGTPSAKNFNNWMTGGFGGVAVNYDGTRIAFSNNGIGDGGGTNDSDLFVFGRSETTLTYLGGVQTAGWGKICRCIFTKTGDKLFVGNYADNDIKIYTIDNSSISLLKTITTSGHTTAGQLGINETGTKMVYLKDNTNFTVRTTSDNWANSTETTKTYPSSRQFNHVGGLSSNQMYFYGRWLDMSPNGNTMIVSTITGDNKRGRVGVYDISDLNSITEVKYLDAEAGTYNDNFKVGNNVVCKNTHYGFTANGESSGNWKSYNVFKSYDPTPTTNYYNQEFKGGNLFLNGNLTIDGTLSVGTVSATGNTITYDADTTMNKRLYVNNSDLSLDFITNGHLDIITTVHNTSEKRVDLTGSNQFGFGSEISTDGNYMIIGEPEATVGSETTAGKGYIYKRDGNNWALNHTLTANSATWMQKSGQYVSITHDGEFAVLAGINHWNGANFKPVLSIFKRNDNNNNYDLNNTILYGGEAIEKYTHVQIRKRNNGNILLFHLERSSGKVYVIKSTDNGVNWSASSSNGTDTNAVAATQTDTITNQGYWWGKILQVDSRATRLITADEANSTTRIYDIDSDGMCTINKTIIHNVYKVAINAEGNTICIGDYANSGNNGRIKVYKYSNNDWSTLGSNLDGHGDYEYGYCMAINPDGDKIAVASVNNDNMMAIFKYMKISEIEYNASPATKELSPTTAWKVLYDRGTSWDVNKYYWYQYSTTFTATSKYKQLSWGSSSYVLGSYDNKVDLFEVNFDTETTIGDYTICKVASNINISGTFFADVSLNHNLVVPGNITIVDGSANNYGAYTTFTNKDATAYFNVGKSASNVFNIVDNNNVGVYMASGGNSMTSTSDERLKTEIESLDDPTEKLMQLKPCTYKWKTQEDDKKHVGFIAQEVEEVLPELVNETTYPNGASYKGVAMSDLIPYLIKSIQEREIRINKLENK